jgi:hypothetical protein
LQYLATLDGRKLHLFLRRITNVFLEKDHIINKSLWWQSEVICLRPDMLLHTKGAIKVICQLSS